MQKRLIASGARPINNLVDITNYVLFELGQPMHAFDYDLIEKGKIIVRKAKNTEKIVTLDEEKRDLKTNSLVIADNNKSISLDVVMGGMGSEVNPITKTILLESAYFNPKNISRTSRELGLSSESSIRCERGVDPNLVVYASKSAARLYQKLAGAKVLQGTVDKDRKKINPVNIKLRTEKVNKVLGTDINNTKIISILKSLEIDAKKETKGRYRVKAPTFRPDLEREIDLIEEVARIYG